MLTQLINTLKDAGSARASITLQVKADGTVAVVITPIFEAGSSADSGKDNPILKAALSLPLTVEAESAEALDAAITSQLTALSPTLAQVAAQAHDASVIVSTLKAAAANAIKPKAKAQKKATTGKSSAPADRKPAPPAAKEQESDTSAPENASPAAADNQGLDLGFLDNGL